MELRCLYSNVDQLLNKIDDVKALIANDNPDIMLFTEVIPKAQRNPIHEPQMKIAGYQLYTNFKFTDVNLGSSGIRGVAIYAKDSLKSNEIQIDANYSDHLWIEIKLKGNDRLLCGCIYRSPTKDRASTVHTTAKVCDILKKAAQRNTSHVVICGDFNYPGIDWENEFIDESSVVLPFMETVQECYFHQHVSQPTRYRHGQEPSLLDLILTNEEGILNELEHKPGLGDSDHECLFFQLNCYADEIIKVASKNYHKGDYVTIRERLKNIDWNAKLQGLTFSEAYAIFLDELEKAMDGCIPNKTNRKLKRNIYLTPEAIRKKDLKNRLWRKYKKSRSP